MAAIALLMVIFGAGFFILYAPTLLLAILVLIAGFSFLGWAVDRWLDI